MRAGPARRWALQIVLLTGMSGAGKTQALKSFEDLGYYSIDNLPASLLVNVVGLAPLERDKFSKLAVVMDVRGGTDFAELFSSLEGLESVPYTVVFLDAPDEVLLRRFSETRRLHPLQSEGLGVAEMIRKERTLLDPLKERADIVIDTGDINIHELREKLASLVPDVSGRNQTRISLSSFGYKYGHPLDSEILFDVRFLPNPYWIDELRDLDGTDDRVRLFVLSSQGAQEFVRRFKDLVDFMLPGYQRERRPYLSIAIGCTGGRHRSVVIAAELGRLFAEDGFVVTVSHRDINR